MALTQHDSGQQNRREYVSNEFTRLAALLYERINSYTRDTELLPKEGMYGTFDVRVVGKSVHLFYACPDTNRDVVNELDGSVKQIINPIKLATGSVSDLTMESLRLTQKGIKSGKLWQDLQIQFLELEERFKPYENTKPE